MSEWYDANAFFIGLTLISALLVLSIFITFNAGVFSLGSIGFMAVGGYVSGIATTKYDLPVQVGIPMGILGAALAGLVVGLLVVRLNGIYMALVTFAMAQAIIVAIRGLDITNGVYGLTGIPMIDGVLPAALLLVLICVGLEFVHRSYVGRGLRAVRLDETLARGLGIRYRRYRLVAMVASGAVAGLAGALNAHQVSVITPSGYNFHVLVAALTFVFVGGIGYWLGPVIAAIVLGFVHETLRSSGVGTDIETLIYGVLLIVLMGVAPQGLGDPRLAQFVRRVLRREKSIAPAAERPLEEARR